jgi:streptomycin 6-kinase
VDAGTLSEHPASGVRDLRERLEARARAWRVAIDEICETATSLLAYGRRGAVPVVLKLIKQPGDEWNAGKVLSAFEGRGVVRVYEYAGGAMLLERLVPGTPLVELSLAGRDDEATDVLAEVIGAMSPRAGVRAAASVRDWGSGFARYAASGDDRLPAELVSEAERLYARLANSQRRPRLLHGDLQHSNVLLDRHRGWVAIDPKGVVGELEYEVGAALRNPHDQPKLFAAPATIERRLGRLAAALNLDVGRAAAWAFAQAVLSAIWQIEDGCSTALCDSPLRLAEAIRPMLHE